VISKNILRKILSTTYVVFTLWFLGPICIELMAEPPEGDEVGLLAMLLLLISGSVLTLALWLKPEKLNQRVAVKWIIGLHILLLAILVLLFAYSSWILLVSSLAIFYVWLKRIFQRKSNSVQNLTWLAILGFIVSLFVLSQLIP